MTTELNAAKEARDILHLRAIEAWQAIASSRPAPDLDLDPYVFQIMHEAFTIGSGVSPVEQLIDDWYDLARQCGITVNDENGDLRADIDDAITRTVIASIWFGITTGYFTLTGRYNIPRKFLP